MTDIPALTHPANQILEDTPRRVFGVRIAHRALRILRQAALGVACLTLCAFFILYGPSSLDIITQFHTLALAGLGLSMAYLTLRGLALRSAASATGVPLSVVQGLRLFCEGVCVELTCWPGKLAADAHRIHVLGSSPLRQRITALVIFRASSIFSSMLLLLLAIGLGTLGGAFDARAAAGLALAWALGAFLLSRRQSSLHPFVELPALTCVITSMLAHTCDALLFAMLAANVAHAPPLDAAAWFVILGALAASSMVPLGIGVLDTACVMVLVSQFGAQQPAAIAVLLAYRFLGPALTILAGFISLLARESMRPVPDVAHAAQINAEASPVNTPMLFPCKGTPPFLPPRDIARSH